MENLKMFQVLALIEENIQLFTLMVIGLKFK